MPKAFLISRKRMAQEAGDGLLQEPSLSKAIHLAYDVADDLVRDPGLSNDRTLFNHDFRSHSSPASCLSNQTDSPSAVFFHKENKRFSWGYPSFQMFTADNAVESSLETHFSDHRFGYDNQRWQFGARRQTKHDDTPSDVRVVKRSLSFSGKTKSSFFDKSKPHVGIDINNNKNDGDDSVYDRKCDLSEIQYNPKEINQISSSHYLKDFKGVPVSFPCLKDPEALSFTSSCHYSSGKPETKKSNSNSFNLNSKLHHQIRHHQENKAHFDKSSVHKLQAQDSYKSSIQRRNISAESIRPLNSSLLTHSISPSFSSSNQISPKQSDLNDLNETSKSTAITIIMTQNNSKRHEEMFSETVRTSVTSPDGNSNLSPVACSRTMAPSCSTLSQNAGCHDQGLIGTRVMTPERRSVLPISPQSSSSNSSSPSSVRSSSLLKSESWSSQTDLLASPPVSSTSSSLPTSPFKLSSTVSPSSSPSKHQATASARKFIFWDGPVSELNTLKTPWSRDYISTTSSKGDIKDENSKVIFQSLSPKTDFCQSNAVLGNKSSSEHTEHVDQRSHTSCLNIPTSKRQSTELHYPEGLTESKQKKIKGPRKSFTIDSIMSRDNHHTVNEESQDYPVGQGISMPSISEQSTFQHKKDLQDINVTTNVSSEHRETPHISTGSRESGQRSANIDGSMHGSSVTAYHQCSTGERGPILDVSTVENKSQNDIQSQKQSVAVSDNSKPGLPSSKINLLSKEKDKVLNLTCSKSPSPISLSSSSTVHKLHRPLPLLPRPTPVFPSYLPYSSIPANLYQSSPFLSPVFRSEFHGQPGVSDLAVNSDVPFVSNVLPFINDSVCHKSVVDSKRFEQLNSLQLMRQNNKSSYINNLHSSSTSCFDNRNDGNIYCEGVYLPLEHMKYTQGDRSPGSGIRLLHDARFGDVKEIPEQSRNQLSGLSLSQELVTTSYLNAPNQINKMASADKSGTAQSQSRTRLDSVDVDDDLPHSSDGVISPLKALGVSGGKSFKGFLETANVKVEFINKGHGIKNPLLNAEFGESKLDILTHAGNVPCPVCHLSFQSSRELQRHLKGHKEIKRFLCTFCGKGFNDTFDLKRHTRTHTGVRPYKCPQCDKAFTQRCSLESHCRKIHGVSPLLAFNQRRTKLYVCEDCGHSTPTADEHFGHLRHTHAHTIDDIDKELTSS